MEGCVEWWGEAKDGDGEGALVEAAVCGFGWYVPLLFLLVFLSADCACMRVLGG